MKIDSAAQGTATWMPSRREVLLAASLSAIPIFATIVLRVRTNATFFTLIRDPSRTAETAPHLGFLSQVGIFFWVSAAALCIFSSHVLSQETATVRIRSFLRMSGFFTLFLAIDDIFLIHDYLFPYILGIPEKPLFAAYAAFVAWLGYKHWSIIRGSKWPLLATSLIAFGISIFIDKLNYPSEYRIFFEDSAKLIGIVLWMVYFGNAAASAISSRLAQHPIPSTALPNQHPA